MYDEPEVSPRERLKPSEIEARGRPMAMLRAVAAAVPAVGFWLWLSALLGVGPMDGREVTGLAVTLLTFLIWRMTFGRSVIAR